MAVIANHPESRYPHPGVPTLRPDWLPPLTGMTADQARETERSIRGQTMGLGEFFSDSVRFDNGGWVMFAMRPPEGLEVNDYGDISDGPLWIITSHPTAGIYAALYDAWAGEAERIYNASATAREHGRAALERAGDVSSGPDDRLRSPGQFITQRHGHDLVVHHRTGELRWYRPGTWEPVPHQVQVTTDQLPDDPGIREWAAHQPAGSPAGICGFLAPELMTDALIGYPELARARGVTVQRMRDRVSEKGLPPTFPDLGARWTRPAARQLVADTPPATWYLDVYRRPTAGEYVYGRGWRRERADLTFEDARAIAADMRARAEATGLTTTDDRDYGWTLHDTTEGSDPWHTVEPGGVAAVAVRNNAEELAWFPPEVSWPDLEPAQELPAAPKKRPTAAQARRLGRRRRGS